MDQSPSTVRVGIIQHPCGTDSQLNWDQARQMIRDAAQQGAQIVATQELFSTRYFPQTEDDQNFDLAEPIPGSTTQRLGKLAKELGIEIVGSLFEKRTDGIYHNTAVTVNTRGQIIGAYRKMHIPDDPGFYEKYYFTPGDAPVDNHPAPGSPPGTSSGSPPGSGWSTTPTRFARIATLICWDQWFPEAARLASLHGAQILFYPTAIGWNHNETPEERDRQKQAWQVMHRAHAIANGAYVVAINRVGIEDDLRFWGGSFATDPGGTVIAEASQDNPSVLVFDCDLSRITKVRRDWPFLRDRRIDAYHGLLHRYLDPPPRPNDHTTG